MGRKRGAERKMKKLCICKYGDIKSRSLRKRNYLD